MKKLTPVDYEKSWQILGFCFAGLIGFVIEYAILSIGLSIGVGAFAPRLVSAPLAILGTFLFNKFVTFRNFSVIRLKEILSYYMAMWLGIVVNLVVYSILLWFDANHFAALIIATLFTAIINFFSSRSVLMSDAGDQRMQ